MSLWSDPLSSPRSGFRPLYHPLKIAPIVRVCENKQLPLLALFGSFSLILALVLCVYTLLSGRWPCDNSRSLDPARFSPERLVETSRRAGIASFIAVTAAALALVYLPFTDNFSIDYILHHSNRACRRPISSPRSGRVRRGRY